MRNGKPSWIPFQEQDHGNLNSDLSATGTVSGRNSGSGDPLWKNARSFQRDISYRFFVNVRRQKTARRLAGRERGPSSVRSLKVGEDNLLAILSDKITHCIPVQFKFFEFSVGLSKTVQARDRPVAGLNETGTQTLFILGVRHWGTRTTLFVKTSRIGSLCLLNESIPELAPLSGKKRNHRCPFPVFVLFTGLKKHGAMQAQGQPLSQDWQALTLQQRKPPHVGFSRAKPLQGEPRRFLDRVSLFREAGEGTLPSASSEGRVDC